MMKRSLAFTLVVFASVYIFAQGSIIFMDSITGARLYFPEGSKIEESKGFKKAEVDLGTSYLSIYSVMSPDDKQFTWNQMNEFDKGNKYGTLISSEKVSEELDGWIRYYKSQGKRDYISCVTLIRGKKYAFYILETAYQEESLQTPVLLQTAEFPHAHAPLNGVAYWIAWIVFGLLLLFPIIFFPLLKKLSDKTFLILAICEITAFCLWCVFKLDLGWPTLLMAGAPLGGFLLVSATDSWWDAISKFFENFSN